MSFGAHLVAVHLVPELTISRWLKSVLALVVMTLIGLLVCLQFGTERIPFSKVIGILLNLPQPVQDVGEISPSVILLDVRLPRLLVSFLVGASLATVGVALQALLRNPLADPFILGISG